MRDTTESSSESRTERLTEPPNRMLTRRTLIGAIGLGAFGATAPPASAQVVDQESARPTLTVSSPECETLTLDRGDRGPPTEVVVDGPESFTTELGRGETLTRTVDAGTYEISATVRGERTDRAVVVEGSPVEVAECLPPGVDAWLDCSEGRPLHFYNPLDRNVYVRWRRTVAETGQVNSTGRSRLDPGETEDWPVTRLGDDVRTYHYEYWITEGYYGDEPEVPINGSLDPLIITEPCEELDLPRSPPDGY